MKTTFLYILIAVFIAGCLPSVKIIAPDISSKSLCKDGETKCLKKEALAKRTWEVQGADKGNFTFERSDGEGLANIKIVIKKETKTSLNPLRGITRIISFFADAIAGRAGRADVSMPTD